MIPAHKTAQPRPDRVIEPYRAKLQGGNLMHLHHLDGPCM
jgi:hypothetical protein